MRIEIKPEDMIDPEKRAAFNDFMAAWQDAMIAEAERIAEEFSVSPATAEAIQYLRSRSRWTQDKENELINRDHSGNPITLNTVLTGEF